MPYTDPFYTSEHEPHPVYHNNSACGDGQRIIRDGHKVDGEGVDRTLCEDCARRNKEEGV
jgi:hypothetical protein